MLKGTERHHVPSQAAGNDLENWGMEVIRQLPPGFVNHGLRGLGHGSGDDHRCDIEEAAKQQGNAGKPSPKALDDFLRSGISAPGSCEHPLGIDRAVFRRGKAATILRIGSSRGLLGPFACERSESAGGSHPRDVFENAELTCSSTSAVEEPAVNDEARTEPFAGKECRHVAIAPITVGHTGVLRNCCQVGIILHDHSAGQYLREPGVHGGPEASVAGR